MKYLIVLVLLLSGCATTGGANEESQHAANVIIADYKSGRIGELEFARKALAQSRQFQPEAHGLHAHLHDRVMLASAFERGEITRAQFGDIWEGREIDYNMRLHQAQNQPMTPMQTLIMMNMINNGASNLRHSLDRY